MKRLFVLAAAGAVTASVPAMGPPAQRPEPQAVAAVPWAVGERLEYGVKFSIFNVGRAYLEVLGIDTVRGEPSWHVQFVIHGRALTYTLQDSLQSWVGMRDLVSRRFIQDTDENGHMRYRHYEIYPERRLWVRNDADSGAAAGDPLDEASFFFFVRTLTLEIGQTYTFNRYFQLDRNPVTLQVLQHQNINVPAGRFSTVAVRPIFKSRGLFGQGGQAVIWFADDSTRIPVRIRTSLPVGTLEMSLRSRR